MRPTTTMLWSVLMVALVALPASFTAQRKDEGKETENAANLPEVIWRDPGDIASLNLFYGAGGRSACAGPEQ
jgi:hypothetical protein